MVCSAGGLVPRGSLCPTPFASTPFLQNGPGCLGASADLKRFSSRGRPAAGQPPPGFCPPGRGIAGARRLRQALAPPGPRSNGLCSPVLPHADAIPKARHGLVFPRVPCFPPRFGGPGRPPGATFSQFCPVDWRGRPAPAHHFSGGGRPLLHPGDLPKDLPTGLKPRARSALPPSTMASHRNEPFTRAPAAEAHLLLAGLPFGT